jgi:phenylpropionate dioxygenase-like ring-hydroxylating dioxygenase large terminal subunit
MTKTYPDPVALSDWYVVATSTEIEPGMREQTRLLGLDLLLTRNAAGICEAFVDRGDGQMAKVSCLAERYGLIWVCLGTPERDIVEIAEFGELQRRVIRRGRIGVATSGQRIIENFVDLSHFSFVHTGTLGGYDSAEVPDYRVEFREDGAELWATECRFLQPMASAAAGGAEDVFYDYRIPSPFISVIYKDSLVQRGKKDLICLFVQPLEETVSVVHSCALVHDGTNSDTHILHFYHEIFAQDRSVLIHQMPKRLPVKPRRDIPTISDATSIAYRRWLDKSGLEFGLDRSLT